MKNIMFVTLVITYVHHKLTVWDSTESSCAMSTQRWVTALWHSAQSMWQRRLILFLVYKFVFFPFDKFWEKSILWPGTEFTQITGNCPCYFCEFLTYSNYQKYVHGKFTSNCWIFPKLVFTSNNWYYSHRL